MTRPGKTICSGGYRPILAAACASVFFIACDEEKAPAASPSASVGAAAPSASAEPEPPWFFGTWSGKLDVEPASIDLDPAHGGIRAWQGDAGKRATGAATLQVDVTEEGIATGKLKGALGKLAGAGAVEGDRLTMRLSPEPPVEVEAFSGTLAAKRDGEAFKGTLRASSGDSTVVRRATVTLKRAP